MLKICNKHHITYNDVLACPICHLEKIIEVGEEEIKELKAEIKELKEKGNGLD